MALIECSKCGKKVSDTTKVCIHCGADIGEKQEVKVDEKPKTEENVSQKKKYNSFNNEMKLKYEKEFLENNFGAKKYRRKGLEFKKIISLGETSAILGGLLIFGYRYLLNKVFDGVVYNENYGVIAAAAAFLMIAFGCLMMICSVVARTIYNRTFKSYVYLKTFSKWLEDKYEIDYQPEFFTDKEKAIYEKIDLNVMKL